ncbi:hypothetical protein SETIT_3G122900v2 [Setaria italica]|uniref:non-specific serine/threonine protein kinase n=1 Tax=Setaria italica TaxID=4555 RepID=A0A368QEU5_SETIT|nr:hypothetical protein SETIT_3G122900v2 [Setaria italica]
MGAGSSAQRRNVSPLGEKGTGGRKGSAGTGCWIRLCVSPSSSRAKVDTALCGARASETRGKNDSIQNQPVRQIVPASASPSKAENVSAPSIVADGLTVAFQLRKFTFNELRFATRNFRPESLLGEGGFGRVYKGWIGENGTAPVRPGTGLIVAVKTLNREGQQGHKEWVAEVNFLGNLQHPNLVKLIGYCIEDNQRQLVYEFMPRGSLEHHLFRSHLTSKSDVYSFGVVLLELMTGRRSMDKNRPAGEHNLVEWARPHLKQRQGFQALMDPKLGGNISMKGAYKVTQLARACLTRDPKARPLMSQVVEILKPLPDLKDMASSSGLYYSLQAEQAARLGYPSGSRSMSPQSSFAWNGQQPMRSLSHAPRGHASPYRPQGHASPYLQLPRSNAK